jgi:mono/diheme cytochrome c family protein
MHANRTKGRPMKTPSMRLHAPSLSPRPVDAGIRGRLLVGLCIATAWLAGCSVELQNRQAAQQVAQESRPEGSVYVGWRVFQNKCAACHGPSATGTANGPDLRPRVRDMDSRKFVSVVLKRYDWSQIADQPRSDGAALDALVEKIIRRQDYPLNMPAMEGEPSVNAHLVDLHAYLSARAFGTQGPGRPER